MKIVKDFAITDSSINYLFLFRLFGRELGFQIVRFHQTPWFSFSARRLDDENVTILSAEVFTVTFNLDIYDKKDQL